MRMWNINPKLLCNKHLIAEHGEIHAMIGNLKKSGTWAKRLTKAGYLEPQNAKNRHNKLVVEMLRRELNHNSILETDGIKLPIGKVDKTKSIRDLKARCKKCKV